MSVTMGEGRTPLVESRRHAGLYFKLESTNPSGSYKDRFVAAELTGVLASGRKVCVATSSGNTGSSLAAYCARYGIACVILVNATAPAGKLQQMLAHGATVIRIPDFVTSPEVTAAVFAELAVFTAESPAALVVSAFRYCPVGMAGVQEIARELVAQLPSVDHVFVPVGSGGLFAAISREMRAIRPAARVHAVQPLSCPTLWNAYRDGSETIVPVHATTRISGLSVPFDIDASLALRLLRDNGGQAFGVSDEEVFAAHREMLRTEGIYSEPAGAAALAGYRQAFTAGSVQPHETCVCLVTGHGFKDLASVELAGSDVPSLTADAAGLRSLLRKVVR